MFARLFFFFQINNNNNNIFFIFTRVFSERCLASQGLYEKVPDYLCTFARAFIGAQVRSEIHRRSEGHIKVLPQTWFRDLFLHSAFVWWEHRRVTPDMTTHTGNFISVSWTHITRVQNEICTGSVNLNANHLVTPRVLERLLQLSNYCSWPCGGVSALWLKPQYVAWIWGKKKIQTNKKLTGYGTIRDFTLSLDLKFARRMNWIPENKLPCSCCYS